MITAINTGASPYYESIEFNLPTANVDYNVANNQSSFLSNFGPGAVIDKYPTEIIIRTNNTVTIKFNSSTNDPITVTASDSPLAWRGEVKNIFITNNSGNIAEIKIIALP